jgi:hypothetical protein
MKGHKPGGGIKSRVNREVGYRQGAPRRAANKAGVGQFGQAQGDHITEHGATGYRGIRAFDGDAGYPSKLGNEWSASMTGAKTGPGKSVTTNYGKSGSQGMQGAANPGMPATKGELFPGWPAKR